MFSDEVMLDISFDIQASNKPKCLAETNASVNYFFIF